MKPVIRQLSPTRTRRLAVQGYGDLPPALLGRIAPFLRLTPAICATSALVIAALGAPPLAWEGAPTLAWLTAGVALLGVVLPRHPYDLIYHHLVRPRLHTPILPRTRAPRRFASALAALWLTAIGFAFAAGHGSLGALLGVTLAVATMIAATTDYCVACEMHCRLPGAELPGGNPRRRCSEVARATR